MSTNESESGNHSEQQQSCSQDKSVSLSEKLNWINQLYLNNTAETELWWVQQI